MNMVTLTIDGTEVTVPEGKMILDAAQQAGIYIQHLCSHPDLPPAKGLKPAEVVYRGGKRINNSNSELEEYEGCQLCMVEIEGVEDFQQACNTPVAEGMIVHTDTPEVQEFRIDRLAFLLAKHPHACLTCSQKEGCARFPCSMNIPENERCCAKFGHCELQSVAEYVGIKEGTPRYRFKDLPAVKDEPLFDRDYNLCIGCTRCVRVCRDVRGVGALDFVLDEEGRAIVGTIDPALKESGCKFCTACVEVCPTGALLDKVSFTEAQAVAFPPRKKLWVDFKSENMSAVPEVEGIYQLLDEKEKIIYIKGAINLRRELEEQLEVYEKARYFMYEVEPMYTKRESELLQQFIAQHGEMPEGNRELEELF